MTRPMEIRAITSALPRSRMPYCTMLSL
jgi:hypothetical protein